MNKKGTEVKELTEKLLGKKTTEKVLKNEEDIILPDNFPNDVDEELNLSSDKLKMYNSMLLNVKKKKQNENLLIIKEN